MPVLTIPSRLETGAGSIQNISQLVNAEGCSKVLIIMDNILAQEPIRLDKRVTSILEQANIENALFCECLGEPTDVDVNKAVEIAKKVGADCIVAIGGGSALDLAKAVAVFACNDDIKWNQIAQQTYLKCLPIIAAPTTAGTGSEATKITVIINTETNSKMNPGHQELIPKVAILDPELSVSLPQKFTAFTGMDAITHAMEGYVSTRANELTDLYALEAIRICGEALPKAYEDGADLDARQKMLLGSYYAGVAFSNASTNLAHAGGRALGTAFNVPHGLSVTLLLPFVMGLGIEAAQERYANVALALGADEKLGEAKLANEAIRIINEYNNKFGIWNSAKEYITDTNKLRNSISKLVEDTMIGVKLNPTGNNGIITNRKVPTEEDVAYMFEQLAKRIEEV
ncbi:alcohol dehydrogenase class IV [Desulfitispora alkaliphila]|uniref:iron-containing alcohol dehydrogenase n=1 Tax=Desulfitispora alkaliphila TaxID=622674 RepID=UPI003D20ACD4